MSKRKDKSIVEFNVPALGEMCKEYLTPIGMSIAMEAYDDKRVYFGVIKEAGNLNLVYACYTANRQKGLAELVAVILYKYYTGEAPDGTQLIPADLTSSQVAALTGYHTGVTVVLNLDSGMVEVYSCDSDAGYIPPASSDWIFYNQEFCACACAADIPALFKVNEFQIGL